MIRRAGPDRMMVFQEFDQLLPWKTVQQNVVFALGISDASGQGGAGARAHYIDKVNLTKFADSYPHMLSGGMKQRVAIARRHGDGNRTSFWMDEPFAALDARYASQDADQLLALVGDTRFTVLFVTHSSPRRSRSARESCLLSPHPAR